MDTQHVDRAFEAHIRKKQFMNKLRVAIYQSPDIPQSFRVYAENVVRFLPSQGLEIIPFAGRNDMPKTADVLWDIRSGGGNPPREFMLGGPPLVITVHGFAPVSLSGWEYFKSAKGVLMSRHYARQKLEAWKRSKEGVSMLIAVSNFTKAESAKFTGIADERISVCHHGVNTEYFSPNSGSADENYFLHISNDEPRKNLSRIVRAFLRLRKIHDVELVLKLPENQVQKYRGMEGIRTIGGILPTEDLASLYRNALAFVFPSLYEGFGMPILEAMACGCPVITSNVSACPEIAGNAALLVDPRSEDALFESMKTLYLEKGTRHRLKEAGMLRARSFGWQASAQCHVNVFRKATGNL